MNIILRQLRQFHALARERQFGRADEASMAPLPPLLRLPPPPLPHQR